MRVIEKFLKLTSAISLAVIMSAFSPARAQGLKATLEQQLESQYTLTTPTADYSDFSITGSVLILQKRGFTAGAVSNQVPTTNTYSSGQIRADIPRSAVNKACGFYRLPGCDRIQSTVGPSRDFVNGENLYVTQITVDRSKDAIIFALISDYYPNAGRYKGSLRFQFPKGSVGSTDLAQLQPTIAEVFRVAPPLQPVQPPPPVVQTQSDTPLAPITPPPPPPPDVPAPVETKVVEFGQTKNEVEAILGKPDKTAKVGTKEIYQYKDIKITFVNGRMTDAQ